MRTAKSPESPDLQFAGRKHRTLQTHWNPRLDLRATIVQCHPMTTPLGKYRVKYEVVTDYAKLMDIVGRAA